MFKLSGGRVYMKCNHKGCSGSVSVLIIQGKSPLKTESALEEAAKNVGWDHKKHLCSTHK